MANGVGKKAGRVVVWILLSLLIVGLAGFGIGSFGGSASAVATIGNRDVTVQEYFRALSNAIRAEQAAEGRAIGRAEAEARGIPRFVQGQLATQAALDDEVDALGISVGDERVGEQILAEPGFQGPSGEFDRGAYEFLLRQNGWSVARYEEDVREEASRTILQGAVSSGVDVPAPLNDTLMTFFGERRDVAWRRYTADDLTVPVPEPTEEELRAFHETAEGLYTLPETKRITYVMLRPEELAATLEPTEEAIETLYQDRIDTYVLPERRLVERIVFEDQAAAESAAARLDAGDVTFSDIAAERNLALADIDLGDVTAEDLDGAAEPIFALATPGVTGPLESPFGPALYRVNGVLNASTTTLDEVRDELSRELSMERARRALADMVTDVDDRLAAGATLEDLAEETELRLAQIDYYPGVEAEVVGYEGFREAAEAVEDGDFPEITEMEDGSLLAVRLDEIVPPRRQAFDDVRVEVEEDWRAAETVALLTELAESAEATLSVGGGLGGDVQIAEGIGRDAVLEGAPEGVAARAFEMEEGDTAVIPGDRTVALVQLTGISPPDPEDQSTAFLAEALGGQLRQSFSSDILQLYTRALLAEKGIRFNETSLNAVHTQVFN